LREKTITQTKGKLDKYCGESAPSIPKVNNWLTEFRCNRTSTEDTEHSGRPVFTSETIEQIPKLVLADPRLKVKERHLTWRSGFNFESLLGYEKAFRKIGVAFAHNRSQTQPYDNFTGVFVVVQPQYERVFAPFYNRGQNVDLPQHTEDQKAVETVDFLGVNRR
jgi:hypothetical protein